jgi:hypothetical protein
MDRSGFSARPTQEAFQASLGLQLGITPIIETNLTHHILHAIHSTDEMREIDRIKTSCTYKHVLVEICHACNITYMRVSFVLSNHVQDFLSNTTDPLLRVGPPAQWRI